MQDKYLHAKKCSTKYLNFQTMLHYLLTHEAQTILRWIFGIKGTPDYLMFHDHSCNGSLDHVGAIQAVHAINSENSFLLTYYPSLIDPC